MNLKKLSRKWFNKFNHEDIYGYIEKRFFPIVYKYISEIKGKVLDAGCGFGNPYLEKLQIDKSLTIGIDIDPTVRGRNKLHNNFIIDDLHYFDTEEQFEAIISVNTWEHLHSPDLVLKNFYNCLSDRGIVIVIAPQSWHYINIIGRILPNGLKDFSWRILKNHSHAPYPVHYYLCSKKTFFLEARHQNYKIQHFSSVEGPPLWFAKVPPLFILMSLVMSVINKYKILENIRSTFIAVLEK